MNYQKPYISIIIPAKNESNYIGRCLQGIKNLNYDQKKIEVVVVDNGSTDSTSKIATSMGAHVLKSSASSIATLRNRGTENTRGDIIGFVDADCIVHPDWLAKAVGHFANDMGLCAVGAPEAPPANNATWVEETWTGLKHGNVPLGGVAYTSWCASGALLIKRASFEKIGGFNENLATCEDADLSIRLSGIGTIILDYTVPFQHLRGSRTLTELFKREMWRGSNNIAGFFGHGVNIRELSSVLAPLIFVFFLFGWVGTILMMWFWVEIPIYFSILPLGVSFMIPLLMLLKKNGPPASLKVAGRAYCVCFVYLLARGCGSIFPGARTW